MPQIAGILVENMRRLRDSPWYIQRSEILGDSVSDQSVLASTVL